MGKVLIVGSSHSIVETFSKKFIDDDLNFLNFRTVWNNRNIDYYDVIVVSGYHHQLLWENLNSLNDYALKYYKFLSEISKKTKSLLFISTYIPKKISFSRVSFFYNLILKKILYNENIKILSFKKIIDSKLKKSLSFYFLQKIGIKFTSQNELVDYTYRFYLENIPRTKFYFLGIKRPLILERVLRLFDID